MDISYWNQYYSKKIDGDSDLVVHASNFAKFANRFISPGVGSALDTGRLQTLIDLGSGNGRDTVFFADTGNLVTACDSSQSALAKLAEDGFCTIHKPMQKLDDEDGSFDVVYSRFSLHSLTQEEQDAVFRWAESHCRKTLCIETRSVFDPRYGKGWRQEEDKNAFVDTHYRRFTTLDDLVRQAREHGFTIVHAEINFTDAWHGEDKAVVNRLIATKE